MATRTQYDICKAVYDEEASRSEELINRAKTFLAICTFFLGGSAFKLALSYQQAPLWTYFIFAGGVFAFALSFLLIVLSLGILPYEGIFDPDEYIDALGEDVPSDEDFLDDRIADIAVACRRNVEQNDYRARFLAVATYVMFVGIVLTFVAMFLAYPNTEGN